MRDGCRNGLLEVCQQGHGLRLDEMVNLDEEKNVLRLAIFQYF